jgi:hypothetical protein
VTVDELYQYASDLLDVSSTALLDTIGGVPTIAFVSPGPPVFDCCPMLSVDVRGLAQENTSPLAPAPVARKRVVTTGQVNIVTLVVTIVRCYPLSEDNADLYQPPGLAALEDVARQCAQDAYALWHHIPLAIREGELFERCPGAYLDAGQVIPQQGGCVGWAFPVRAPVQGYTDAT